MKTAPVRSCDVRAERRETMSTAKPKLRDRLRPLLLGAASLFDLSGMFTYREAQRYLPPADDWKAVGGYFGDAGRMVRDAMNGAGSSGRKDDEVSRD